MALASHLKANREFFEKGCGPALDDMPTITAKHSAPYYKEV
jgi:hypothetical protein